MDFTTGLNTIWTEDKKFQTECLDGILSGIRGLTGEPKDRLLQYMIQDQMFYVPNDIYMSEIFGEEITNFKYGIYTDGMCKLCYRLAMPMRLLDNTIIGFIGYTNKDDFNEDSEYFIKYLYPPKYLIQKSRYIYITRDEFLKAIEEEYICIVDGLFDQKALEANGINALSLCGSDLTEYHKLYLNSIKHKVIIADNDEAGRKLAKVIKKVYPDSVEIYQGKTKDIDSYMKTVERIEDIKNTINSMKKEGFLISHKLNTGKLGGVAVG